MKKIKIFLASSIEDLKQDRLEIGNYFNLLNEMYFESGIHFSLVKCENYESSISLNGKQSQFDDEIKDSDLCFFLFFRKVGEYTRHEFEVALEAFKQNEKPRIVTYFKEVESCADINDEVLSFMSMLDSELNHYYNKYNHIDTLKLGVLMQIKLLKLDNIDLSIQDGEVRLNGQPIAQIENVPLFKGNSALRELTSKKIALKKRLAELKQAYLSEADLNMENEIFSVKEKIAHIDESLIELQRKAMDFAFSVFEINSAGKVITPRQKEALRLFEAGDYDGAQILLQDKLRQHELEQAEAAIDTSKLKIEGFVEEELLWIKAEWSLPVILASVVNLTVEKLKHLFQLVKKYELSKYLYDVGNHLVTFLRLKEETIPEAIDTANELIKCYKKHSLDKTVGFVELLESLASAYNKAGNTKERDNTYSSALEICRAQFEIEPKEYAEPLARICKELCGIYKDNDNADDCIKLYGILIGTYKFLCEMSSEYAYELASSYVEFGEMLMGVDEEQSKTAFEKAEAFAECFKNDIESDQYSEIIRRIELNRNANVTEFIGDSGELEICITYDLGEAEIYQSFGQDGVFYKSEEDYFCFCQEDAEVLISVALHYVKIERLKEAKEAFESALDGYERLCEEDKKNSQLYFERIEYIKNELKRL